MNYQQIYYRNNRDKFIEYGKRYRKKHPNLSRNRWEKNREKENEYKREWRHKKGISKKYISKYGGVIIPDGTSIEKSRIYQKRWKQTEKGRLSQKRHNLIHRTRTRNLSIQTIQQIYEENIKQYGTLTCYLCLKPIEFKQDSLDHKIPLVRGGTNVKENLAIAHRSCNCRKKDKTVEEFLLTKGGVEKCLN